MVDTQELNNSISEFSNAVKEMVDIGNIVSNINQISGELQKAATKYQGVVKDIERTSMDNKVVKNSIDKSIKSLEDLNISLLEQNARFTTTVNALLLEAKNESTALYRGFEGTFTSKLDLFKSDVVVENRRINEEVNRKTESSTTELKAYVDGNQNVLKYEVHLKAEEIKQSVADLSRSLDKKLIGLYLLSGISIVVGIAGLVM